MKRFFLIIVVLVAVFYVFNSYIYNEKQDQGSMILSDGQHFGFIRAFTDNNSAIDFDDAEWLTDKAAQDAAIAAGACTEETREECLPNNFFINNESKITERVPVGSNAKVIMQTWKMEETGQITSKEITLAELASVLNIPTMHWSQLPYEITIMNGEIVLIDEVYLP